MEFTGERFLPNIHGDIELEHLHRYFVARELAHGLTVLDIACGEGYGAALISVVAKEVVGVDISPEAIQHAKSTYDRPNLKYMVGSCDNIPLPDATIDLVVSFETIEHHELHDLMMQEIKRVLTPDGVLLISSPDKYLYSDETGYNNPFHKRELYGYEFRELMEKYFANIAFSGQRVVYGSTIVMDDAASPNMNYGLDGMSHPQAARPLYRLALASDGKLPTQSHSLLVQPVAESQVVREREAEIQRLQQELAKYKELQDQLLEREAQISVLQQAAALREHESGVLRRSLQGAEHLSRLDELVGTHEGLLRQLQASIDKLHSGSGWFLAEQRRRLRLRHIGQRLIGRLQKSERVASERETEIQRLVRESAEQRASIEQLQSEVALKNERLAFLSAEEQELQALRVTRLIRLRDSILLEPFSASKVKRVMWLTASLLTPRLIRKVVRKLFVRPGRQTEIPAIRQTVSDTSFDPELYLRLYPDVRAAKVDPYEHFLRFGRAEGRIGYVPELQIRGRLVDQARETILIVLHEGSRTGAPILGYNLIQEFSKYYNIVVLFLGAGGPIIEDCLRLGVVVAGPVANWRSWASERAAKRILEQYSFKFAIVNSIESGFVLPMLAMHFVPTIALIHEFAAYTRPSGIIAEALLWANETIFSSQLTRENAWAKHPDTRHVAFPVIPQGRCTIPVGDTSGTAKATLDGDLVRHAMRPTSFSSDGIVIMGAGAVQLRKGVDLFIQCAHQVVLRAPKFDFRFVWIGKGYDPERDGAYSAYLADQVARSGLSRNFRFVDEVSDIQAAYESADIMLLTSRLDPLPNVALDALSVGLPLVCFDKSTGIADILTNENLGSYCVSRYLDVDDMAGKVIALSQSIELRGEIGVKIRDIAEREFNMETYVSKIHALALVKSGGVVRESRDRDTILSSRSMNYEYWLAPQVPYWTDDEAARRYVRTWARGIGKRKPFPGFHPGVYLEEHGVSDGADPFADYIREGQPRGIWNTELITASETGTASFDRARIALHIHAFYPELLEDMMSRLERNVVRPDLLISVPSEEARAVVMGLVGHYRGGKVDIRIVPNRGRDIGPLLTEFAADVQAHYDVIGHIHTKRSDVLAEEKLGREWRVFLLEHILGGRHPMADPILRRMLERPLLGIVFPEDPHVMEWGENLAKAKILAEKMGICHLPRCHNFPIGTMFWARVKFLEPLFDLGLTWKDYPEEPLPYDGTLLHALERLFPLVVRHAGGEIALSHVPGVTR